MRVAHLLAVAATAVAITACAGAGDDTTDLTGTDPVAATEQPADEPTDDAPADDAPADDAPADDAPADEPADAPTETDQPDEPATGDEPAGDCSAAGVVGDVRGTDLTEETRATAAFLLDAAVRCDEPLLWTAATESSTTFLFGSATVGDVFALPEADDAGPSGWEALARLLSGTTPSVTDDGEILTWPAAAGPDADDAAWQELVDSGLYTEAEVDELRTAPDGYLGWRVGIHADGTWLFLTVGD